MIDPKKIDFNQLPKKFCDGAIGAFNKESFFFAFTSGNNLDVFATTPRTMKDIAIFLTRHVENYEKQFGEIDMTIPEIPSPLQMSDLGSSDKK
ncbi:MAG TPA: hypothetical protein PKZ36_01975 [Candidatus Paceibacterota bacterium]|nr:hypothetical protein [Candidatus Paceibacterota bacterium]HPT18155.1 hypothetical protein [Candidatus Paceibacterota bacterium]